MPQQAGGIQLAFIPFIQMVIKKLTFLLMGLFLIAFFFFFRYISISGQKGIVSNITVLLCGWVSERQKLFYHQCKLTTP